MKILSILNRYKKIGIFLFWILFWELLALGVNKLQLFPTPVLVGKAVFRLIKTGSFYLIVGKTILRILMGFLLAVLTGVLLSILTYYSKLLKNLLAPFMTIIRSIPVVSFIILALVFMGSDHTVILCSFLMVMPMIWSSMETGYKNVSKEQMEMAQVFCLNRRDKLKYIYLPNAYSHLVNALTTGLGFAWKSGIAAEVLGMPELSIGRELFYAKNTFDFVGVFAWTFVVILLSLAMERLTRSLDKTLRNRL